MLKTIEINVSTSKINSECTSELEVELDDYTSKDGTLNEELLEEDLRELMFEMINWGYTIK